MAYDLEEQEQLDELKAWWKLHGNKVLGVATAALLVFAGFQGWKTYQHKQSAQAAVQYEALTQLDGKDAKAVHEAAAQLMEKFSGTPYAARAALIAAKSDYAANNAKSAKANIEWVIAHAGEDAIRSIALLQLASSQLEDKHYGEALKTLGEKHDIGFDGLFADLKGDIYAAQGKKTEAKAAYAEALTHLDAEGRYRSFTEHKLEALGS
jgi:predicted negative regulator of RcsB-dependent stress response